ncbi:hypothetical protein QYE76_023354 [Lolium multiflorum]|uniref:Transposase MuDR plant domain-containing protein n=1 Tax=Lolium multiflorum TaxID=4521 RepID=A0AAD8VS67_LOLMU|nr:hypothetical protein QYE76_023354 [Lolium multiflorum]
MVEWDVPSGDIDPQELERMEEEAVRNVVDKIGESVVWGPKQEVSLLAFDDWKHEYVRIDTGEEMVEEIDQRDGWTSSSVLFWAELIDLNPASRVGYVPSKLACQIVEDDWATQMQIMSIVTELAVLSGEAGAEEAYHIEEIPVSIDWNTVDISDRTYLVIAPMSDIQMATMFGIPVDEKDKKKEKDEAADDGNKQSMTAAFDADADIDLELMHDAADEVGDGHDDELICVYDKENSVIEVGRLFPSMDELRMCFRTYAIKHEFETKTLWTDTKKFYAKCKGYDGGAMPCKWYISARR